MNKNIKNKSIISFINILNKRLNVRLILRLTFNRPKERYIRKIIKSISISNNFYKKKVHYAYLGLVKTVQYFTAQHYL